MSICTKLQALKGARKINYQGYKSQEKTQTLGPMNVCQDWVIFTLTTF